jgi:hypothetical protein
VSDNEVTCENGCPRSAEGRHKFSCRWAGRLFVEGEPVQVLGERLDADEVCVQFTGSSEHRHVSAGDVDRVRYPDVEIHLSTGHDGNIFSILDTATGALRKAGHARAAEQLAVDLFNCGSFPEALQLVEQTVTVTL